MISLLRTLLTFPGINRKGRKKKDVELTRNNERIRHRIDQI